MGAQKLYDEILFYGTFKMLNMVLNGRVECSSWGGVKSKFRKPAKTGGISYAMPNTSPRLGKSHNRNELHKLGNTGL